MTSDAEYNKQCKANFFTCKDIPGQKNVVKMHGRPVSKPMKQTFEKLCNWLDNQAELFTIKKLMRNLAQFKKRRRHLLT